MTDLKMLVFNPDRDGYNTNFWKTIYGTPSVTSDGLVLAGSSITSYQNFYRGKYSFSIKLENAPWRPYLETGASEDDYTVWAAVSDGEFKIELNSVEYNFTGIDFSTAESMDDVAAILQSQIRASTSNDETVVWDTDHFVFTAGAYVGEVVPGNQTIDYAGTVSGGSGTDISGSTFLAGTEGDSANADPGTFKIMGLSFDFGDTTNRIMGLATFGDAFGFFYLDQINGISYFPIEWSDSYLSSNNGLLFEIVWTPFSVKFSIDENAILLDVPELGSGGVMDAPCAFYFMNLNSDDIVIQALAAKDIESITESCLNSNSPVSVYATGAGFQGAVKSEVTNWPSTYPES